MKANEAPEKIYVQLPSRNWIGRTWDETPIKEDDNPNWKNATNIEYTRTDAFIDKACKWLKESITNNPECNRIISKNGVITMGMLIEDFRNYMKGE